MTTRQGGVSTAPYDTMNLHTGGADAPEALVENRARFAAAIGGRPLFLNQMHGSRVVRVGSADAERSARGERLEADAAVSTEPGVACAIQVADCLPVLFAAHDGGAVGAAHAGWRGLAGGVLEATLEAVCEAAGCAPAAVDAWIGAGIGPGHFEVGADVLAAFGADIAGSPAASRFASRGGGKWLADLPELARDRLITAGVANVSGGAWCTYADASRFFSYRRDGVTGRMAAAVWLDRERG
ncbi:peptidoglycan editing factor PgeF [Schlegelella sp. ID0723]|uniref:Purine nucleoside phosphorylase n=2 Tax=Piscinibacter koreensis TaxID=2742824 RepID=A0A7Y6NKU3_9BURK|nr:peptidoglycan editing factor PgeF [Schlegelella koreensis]NUZ05053.1 peptidoglycan editing factor PgeF [Schlegelella koreensis]